LILPIKQFPPQLATPAFQFALLLLPMTAFSSSVGEVAAVRRTSLISRPISLIAAQDPISGRRPKGTSRDLLRGPIAALLDARSPAR